MKVSAPPTRTALIIAIGWCLSVLSQSASAQLPLPAPAAPAVKEELKLPGETTTAAPPPLPADKIDVLPQSNDDSIATRLTSILVATEWYDAPRAEVREGVAFLYGETSSAAYRDWAGDLARKTQDVAAVVNRITIVETSIWDLAPVWSEVRAMGRRSMVALPYVLLGLLVLTLSYYAARIGARIADRILARRLDVPLLREVLARTIGVAIFLNGLYFVLRIYGLTRLAMTVLGGTGIIGLVLGIAFRDISENFLASLFLSVQRPFRTGDLVQIATETGYVQRLNARTTILMTLDGNYVQIPNSTVYKSPITNYMANPNRRESFVISIGYREIISEAQALAFRVLADHPAVLKDPEPWVLVDNLTPDLIQLKVYYWINGREHSFVKVRSSLIRLIKGLFQQNGIRLPASPVAAAAVGQLQTFERSAADADETLPPAPRRARSRERLSIATHAEGGLESEEREIQIQADQSRPPEAGKDLLPAEPDEADEPGDGPGPAPAAGDSPAPGRKS